jgi:hypothetical protein
MSYHKDLGCWLKGTGEYGYMMYPGQCFDLLIGEGEGIPCRLELAGIHKWYVVLGVNGVKMNLRTNEIYQIKI